LLHPGNGIDAVAQLILINVAAMGNGRNAAVVQKRELLVNTLLALMVAATVALAAVALTGTAQRAEANQAIAQKTGKGCPTCHTAPPALNGTGKKYKQTGKL
jgi:hypothetical protein